jgi:ABC-type dipeptide/oligopeptide/nickel transport system permease subunit
MSGASASSARRPRRTILDTLADHIGLFRLSVVQRFFRQRLPMSALLFIVLVTVVCVLAPVLSPYPFDEGTLGSALQGPSAAHWLGTDDVGRDILSRMLYGGRTTLLAALQATALSVALGVPAGLTAALFGGWVDAVLSRVADAVMTFPALLLAVVIVGISGPGLTNAMIAIGVVYAPRLYRVARAAGLNVLNETYISAATTIGCSRWRILLRHMLPNSLSPILVQVSLTMATAVLAEGSLSFLGLGVQPPEASWGALLARAVPQMSLFPAPVIAAGASISLLVLAFNLVGDGARDSIGRERRR